MNWTITIRGIGPAGSEANPLGAIEAGRKYVAELKAAGHQLVEAEVAYFEPTEAPVIKSILKGEG